MEKIIATTKKFAPIALLLLPLVSLAAPIIPATPPRPSTVVPSQRINSLFDILDSVCNVFGWLFVFLIAFAIVMVVIAAFYYLTSNGEPEKVKKAGSMLLYAAIAVGVALLARAIPFIVGNFLGSDPFSSC